MADYLEYADQFPGDAANSAAREALKLIHISREDSDDVKRARARDELHERAAELIEAILGVPKYEPKNG